jgi:hypothetical protein
MAGCCIRAIKAYRQKLMSCLRKREVSPEARPLKLSPSRPFVTHRSHLRDVRVGALRWLVAADAGVSQEQRGVALHGENGPRPPPPAWPPTQCRWMRGCGQCRCPPRPLVLVVDPLSLVNGARVQVVSRPHAAQATFTPFNNIYQKMLERRSYGLYRSKAKVLDMRAH